MKKWRQNIWCIYLFMLWCPTSLQLWPYFIKWDMKFPKLYFNTYDELFTQFIYLFSPGKNVSNYNKKVQYLYQIFGSFTSINAAKFFVRTSSSGDTSTTITFYRLFKYWVSIKVRILERTCRYYMHMFFIIIPVIFSTLTQWNKTIFCSI